MPRARKKPSPQTETAPTETTGQPVTHENEADPIEPEPVEPDIFDEQTALRQREAAQTVAQSVADSTRIEPEQPATEPASNGFAAKHAPGHIANPSSKRRESHAASVRKLPGTLTVMAGDLAVRLIDAGDNRMGIGIRVDVPEGRTLTEDEKAIIRRHVKGEDGEQTGFKWEADVGMWRKSIVRENEFEDQVPPSRPVAIRLDAERRVESLAQALRGHLGVPVSYSERIGQQRDMSDSPNERGLR